MIGRFQIGVLGRQAAEADWAALAVHCAALAIIASLVYGSVVYQICRVGYVVRRRRSRPAGGDIGGDRPPLTVLVPSFREERDVVRQTLLSAALQEYPYRRVVLLIDDPAPDSYEAARQLLRARSLPAEINARLRTAAAPFVRALRSFEERRSAGPIRAAAETALIAELWTQAARTFDNLGRAFSRRNHVDRFFVDQVFRTRSATHYAHARCLVDLLASGHQLREPDIEREYQHLASLFAADVVSFERKRYLNLSHAPNKAMNLNSYIGLIGGHFRERSAPEGRLLEPCAPEDATLSVPATDYVVTLDADSVLLPGYAAELVRHLEQPGSERVGVIQTPYSAFPQASANVERVAGATTDIQYIIHQGFTAHHATYWVGANALVRIDALRDLAVHGSERGYPVTRYIHDRTVIEDTESSVDLVAAGWALHNHPARLAYSATPPDFGALVIQRRRWANGGLIIAPKLVRYLHRYRRRRPLEALLRFHYLTSIAMVNAGLLVLFVLPAGTMLSPLLPLTALPYFALYRRDLMLAGYRSADLWRVYALNLLLVPVNLAGTVSSIRQMATGRAVPFGRTPKTENRTAVPPIFILASYGIAVWWIVGAGFSVTSGSPVLAGVGIANAALLVGGIGAFIGHRAAWSDVRAMAASRVRRAVTGPAPVPVPAAAD